MAASPVAPPANPATRSRRPFGVYVIVLLQALDALSHGLGVTLGLEDHVADSVSQVAGDATALAFMAAGLVVAAGLLLMRRWAWVATMLWVGVVLAAELSVYFRGDDPGYLTMALALAQVLYLNQSEVQRAFERRERRQALA